MRCEVAAVEERAPESGAEGEDQLEPLARDDASTVHLGVVEHDHGNAECLAQGGARIEAMPLRDEIRVDPRTRTPDGDVVRRRHDDSVPDHAGQSHGGVGGVRELLGQVDEGLDEELRRQGIRSRHPDGLGTHGACVVEDGCLDPTAPAVDDQGRHHGVFSAHATAVCRVGPRPGNLTRQVPGGVA